MRHARERQRRLDGGSVSQVVLNLNCRDELIPILRGLQQVYATPKVRDAILKLVERDVSAKSRSDRGREGLSDWCILVLAAVRLGCNLDYDKLHDLAENHRALRSIMEIGEFDETEFSWKRIRDNVCLLQPATIETQQPVATESCHEPVSPATKCPSLTARAPACVIGTRTCRSRLTQVTRSIDRLEPSCPQWKSSLNTSGAFCLWCSSAERSASG